VQVKLELVNTVVENVAKTQKVNPRINSGITPTLGLVNSRVNVSS